MFYFGQRSVIKQGGSYLISLPMQWVKTMNAEMKCVNVEMDDQQRIIVTTVPQAGQDSERTESSTPTN